MVPKIYFEHLSFGHDLSWAVIRLPLIIRPGQSSCYIFQVTTWPKVGLQDSHLILFGPPGFSCWMDLVLYCEDRNCLTMYEAHQVHLHQVPMAKVEDIVHLCKSCKDGLVLSHTWSFQGQGQAWDEWRGSEISSTNVRHPDFLSFVGEPTPRHLWRTFNLRPCRKRVRAMIVPFHPYIQLHTHAKQSCHVSGSSNICCRWHVLPLGLSSNPSAWKVKNSCDWLFLIMCAAWCRDWQFLKVGFGFRHRQMTSTPIIPLKDGFTVVHLSSVTPPSLSPLGITEIEQDLSGFFIGSILLVVSNVLSTGVPTAPLLPPELARPSFMCHQWTQLLHYQVWCIYQQVCLTSAPSPVLSFPHPTSCKVSASQNLLTRICCPSCLLRTLSNKNLISASDKKLHSSYVRAALGYIMYDHQGAWHFLDDTFLRLIKPL